MALTSRTWARWPLASGERCGSKMYGVVVVREHPYRHREIGEVYEQGRRTPPDRRRRDLRDGHASRQQAPQTQKKGRENQRSDIQALPKLSARRVVGCDERSDDERSDRQVAQNEAQREKSAYP